jgi:hypothetical protein
MYLHYFICVVSASLGKNHRRKRATDEPWWSYDVGLVHMVGISTEHNYTVGSKQHLWLENDLKHVNRSVTPWIVFGGHRAMYINSNYSGPDTSDVTVRICIFGHIAVSYWF